MILEVYSNVLQREMDWKISSKRKQMVTRRYMRNPKSEKGTGRFLAQGNMMPDSKLMFRPLTAYEIQKNALILPSPRGLSQ